MWIEGWVKALHDVYSAPVIIRVIKSWNMWWTVNVVHMGEKRIAYRLFGSRKEMACKI
jgi:hypothetical protein